MKEIEVDNHKLMYHPEKVSEWKKTGDSYPVYIEIGPTNYCNHNCVFCALDWMKKGKNYINKDIMIPALQDMAKKGVRSVMFAGEGEPLLHKDMGLFTQKAKEYGLDVSITTNGVCFTESKIQQCLPYLSWIRFSIDAGTPETYAKVHRTKENDFYRAIDNLKNAVRYKKENNLEAVIGVQFLVISNNIQEAVKLTEIVKDIGVDNIQIKPYSHHPQSHNDFYVNPADFNELEKPLEKFNSEDFKVLFRKATARRIESPRDYKECHALPFFALIDSKGNIVPCNLFYDKPEFTYGNLNENSFPEIWKSEKRKQVIQKIKETGIEKCRNGCRLDPSNIYLHRLLNPHPHDNFL